MKGYDNYNNNRKIKKRIISDIETSLLIKVFYLKYFVSKSSPVGILVSNFLFLSY
jgi:hypothetical protein